MVFIRKYRRKVLYGQIRKGIGRILAEMARQKDCVIERGSLQPDHVHMVISVPPKHSVAQVIGYIKGRSAIQIARIYAGKKKTSQASASRIAVTLYQLSARTKKG